MSKRQLRENAHLKIKRLQEENWKLHKTIREQAAEIERLKLREAGEIRYVEKPAPFPTISEIMRLVGQAMPAGMVGVGEPYKLGSGTGVMHDEIHIDLHPDAEKEQADEK